ncbi:MAG: B12-binding domain-containing radical SAM protein [Armatimonadetes bacterium]|nr:B12-binding domain-containing radical SAM protein [Armatimonadota bacterium]
MSRTAITFLAMSGVRVVNPELRELGLTLPGFIERGKVIASLPSLGLLTLAGLTPPDWDIEYVEYDETSPEVVEQILNKSHDLVAISSLSARIEEAYALANRLRQRGKTVILGGLHTSVLPDEAETHVDAVVVGQGEPVWQQVLSDYVAGDLKQRYVGIRSNTFEPWSIPRYDLLDTGRYNRITTQTMRGCPHDCAFCGASRMISDFKRKSLDYIKQELEAITAIWPHPFIELADDNTFVDHQWSMALAQLLTTYRLKWFTETDIRVADHPELLDALRESGCKQLLIGFESVDVSSLSEADSRGWKQKRRDRYLEAIHAIQSRGITVNGCFIMGFDHDTPTIFEETSKFVKESGLAEVQVTIATPFPGTEFYRRLKGEGRLRADRFWDKCTLFDLNFQPKNMSITALESGFRDLIRAIYSTEETNRRKSISTQIYRKYGKVS